MTSEPQIFRVRRRAHGHTLVEFLAHALSVSRSRAKRVLDQRRVVVNGTRVWMARHVLSAGDEVAVAPDMRPAGRQADRLRVLYEDEHLLILDKPAGRLSVGRGSVEAALQEKTRPAEIVAAHRLDRDTSGCMLFLKTPGLRNKVIDLFKSHKVRKQYHAIVAGHLKEKDLRIQRPLTGRTAVTLLRAVDGNRRASHVLARIETGRTHQIRRHLAALGFPVIGDKQYSGRKGVSEAALEAPRQMLHAARLELPHPVSGEAVAAEAPLPKDFRESLRHFHLT